VSRNVRAGWPLKTKTLQRREGLEDERGMDVFHRGEKHGMMLRFCNCHANSAQVYVLTDTERGRLR
jgi:hypothetical protein